MNRRQHLAALSLATMIALTCSPPPAPIIVTGLVEGQMLDDVLVSAGPAAISDGWSVQEDPDAVSFDVVDGRFEASLQTGGSAFLRLTAGDQVVEMFGRPGWSIEVTIDSTSTPRFDGDGAPENEYLQSLIARLDSADGEINRNARTIFAFPPDQFTDHMKGLQAEVAAHLDAFVAGLDEPDQHFSERTAADVAAVFAIPQLYYPTAYRNVTGAAAPVDTSYHHHVGGELINIQTALSSPRYVSFLDHYTTLLTAGAARFDDLNTPREKLMARYRVIRDMGADPAVRDYLYAQLFQHFRTSYGPRDWQPVFEALRTDDPGNPVIAQFDGLLQEDLAIRQQPDTIVVYRQAGGVDLEAHIFYPERSDASDVRPIYTFFHGGGWTIGTPEWGYANAERMNALGLVAVSFEYRLGDVHASNMLDAVDDVRAAITWVREEAETLGGDPDRVLAAGFSAGGHLAGTAAMLPLSRGATERSRPDAIILHSSSYDLTKGSFFASMTNGNPESVSLQHNVSSGLVPALLMHARYDHLAPISEFEAFVARMEAAGNDFEYRIFDVGHFFRDAEARAVVNDMTEAFLARHGFIPATR